MKLFMVYNEKEIPIIFINRENAEYAAKKLEKNMIVEIDTVDDYKINRMKKRTLMNKPEL